MKRSEGFSGGFACFEFHNEVKSLIKSRSDDGIAFSSSLSSVNKQPTVISLAVLLTSN